jgi:fructuronate reductase
MTDRPRRTMPAPPVRALHLGLGAFHRAHQARYTMADPEWGIAAYTFRNAELPRVLTEQDGLYTLLAGEQAELVTSIARAHPGTDLDRWQADVADEHIALITLTVTEAGYRVGPDSAVTRLAAGLRARFQANGAPLTLVPCDNVADNGPVLRTALHEATNDGDPAFRRWLAGEVSVAGTVVDRITPAVTEHDLEAARRLTGLRDLAPVVTEPFTEWLICGDFPHGRPAWERYGARFVDDLGVYQRRKLWLLNAAHSLLAYEGLARGYKTVREAIGDPVLRELVGSWWDTAGTHLDLPPEDLAEYRRRLLDRFAAPGIRHLLRQIAVDGSQKLPLRILPVLRLERAAGRLPDAAVTGLAAWLGYLRGGDVQDARAAELVPLAQGADPVRQVLSAVDPDLAADPELVTALSTRGFPVRGR